MGINFQTPLFKYINKIDHARMDAVHMEKLEKQLILETHLRTHEEYRIFYLKDVDAVRDHITRKLTENGIRNAQDADEQQHPTSTLRVWYSSKITEIQSNLHQHKSLRNFVECHNLDCRLNLFLRKCTRCNITTYNNINIRSILMYGYDLPKHDLNRTGDGRTRTIRAYAIEIVYLQPYTICTRPNIQCAICNSYAYTVLNATEMKRLIINRLEKGGRVKCYDGRETGVQRSLVLRLRRKHNNLCLTSQRCADILFSWYIENKLVLFANAILKLFGGIVYLDDVEMLHTGNDIFYCIRGWGVRSRMCCNNPPMRTVEVEHTIYVPELKRIVKKSI